MSSLIKNTKELYNIQDCWRGVVVILEEVK